MGYSEDFQSTSRCFRELHKGLKVVSGGFQEAFKVVSGMLSGASMRTKEFGDVLRDIMGF